MLVMCLQNVASALALLEKYHTKFTHIKTNEPKMQPGPAHSQKLRI